MPPFGLANLSVEGEPLLAATRDGAAYAVRSLIGGWVGSLDEALSGWDGFVDAVEAALDGPDAPDALLDPAAVTFGPAGGVRSVMWCAGANYTDHIAEMGVAGIGDRSFHFLSPSTARNAHGATVGRPVGARQLDWEVELAAVIGRPARRVAAGDALTYVAGYTVANDVSVRDQDLIRHPIFGVDWTAGKNADGLTPVGPAVVPARFVPDPTNLDLGLTVNGTVRQQSNTSRMIVDLRRQIEALSALVTLQPGDLILTGTPAGTAAAHGGRYLEDGDVMVATISGLGSLRNTVGPAA